jgi:nicotinate-nucleotide adenylyltransferase
MHGDFCYSEKSGDLLHKSGNRLIFLTETCLDISSTKIRSMLASGHDVHEFVPAAVIDYIKTQGLYQSSSEQEK